MFVVFQIYKIFGSFILTLSLEMSDKPKKSAKNVVLTDFKRYPVCGMFFFFSFLVLFPVIRPSHTFTFFISSSPSSRILLRKALRSWSSPSMRSPPIIMVSSSARNSSAMFSPSSFSSTML